MTNTRHRVWIWYAAAWVPVVLLYAYPMSTTRPMSLAQALYQSVTYILPAAVLGVVIWWLTGSVLSWPPRARLPFVAAHAVAAIAFALLWVGSQIGLIATRTGWTIAFNLSRNFASFQALGGITFYSMMAAGSYLVRVASRLHAEQERASRADALRMRAELAALRGQLNPHFLFNTLHTLTALVRRDPETAEHALERFGDMLRYVLDVKRSAREDVTLADELQFVHNYLSLEHLRLGERLTVVEKVDPESLDCTLPSLTLQPLVENAIKYGIAPRARGGSIEIGAFLQGPTLILEVRDDGPGARTDILETATGVGLRAVRQRLETRYERQGAFDVTTAPGEGFIVRMSLPASTGAATPSPVRS